MLYKNQFDLSENLKTINGEILEALKSYIDKLIYNMS